MIKEFKRMIKSKRKIFLEFCQSNNLLLNYQSNKNEFGILKAIFESREYSDYFPFYKKACIVDIGAHYGYFSLFAASNLHKDSTIIAIEPNKSNFANLEKNLRDCRISAVGSFNYAIGGKAGLTKLYHGETPNHSIVEKYILHKHNRGYEEIEAKTLEELITENNLNKIDFLKLDSEGAEYAILENTPDYIYDRIITISMEFHDLKDNNFTGEHLCRLLIKKGFKIVKYKYERTLLNLNYGKIIGTKIFNNL
jgi:FkbM family methyltransferase